MPEGQGSPISDMGHLLNGPQWLTTASPSVLGHHLGAWG